MQQKTGLNKTTQFQGFGYNLNRLGGSTRVEKRHKFQRHPYLRTEFWQNSTNHFWNSDLYSEKSKEYFNDFITRQSQ